MSFKGKNALVTGSSRGIGKGIVLSLAERGAQVAIHYYRNEAAAQATLGRVQRSRVERVSRASRCLSAG